MARHNRDARGADQVGTLWRLSYQPDWLSRVKVSRRLPGGRRRSAYTIFRNPRRRAEAEPGRVVRTDVAAADGSLHFRVAVEDPEGVIEEIVVRTRPSGTKRGDEIEFRLESRLPPPR
jgi:hypothetical protein